MKTVPNRRVLRRRGVGMLFFILFTLPMIWLAGAVSIDAMRVIVGQRQASQIADSAALAGAAQFAEPGEVGWDGTGLTLNPDRAIAAAQELAIEAIDVGVGKGIDNVVVIASVDTSGPVDTVNVAVSYDVDDLVFIGLALGGGESNRTTITGEVSRSASVCIPGVNGGGATSAACSRPTS